MENRFLIDLAIKYGLDSSQVSKIADIVYQCGVFQIESKEGQKIANYICEAKMVENAAEEILEELRLKGLCFK